MGDSDCWTQERIELRAWLDRKRSSLAELYHGSVELMFNKPVPGTIRFVSHAVREIRNRLPDAISGVKGGGRLNYPDRLDELSSLWEQTGLPVDGSLAAAPMATGDSTDTATPDVLIGRTLLSKVGSLIGDHRAAREKPDEAALRLFVGAAPENAASRDSLRPVIKEWRLVTEWFSPHDTGRVDADCDFAEFKRKFRQFERILSTLARGFFDVTAEGVEGLDAILEDTNS